ncbi:MAG: MFS transporter [Armatimonadetes bacterium]|nr:MFS transporter [Armatimonadota bacterium]
MRETSIAAAHRETAELPEELQLRSLPWQLAHQALNSVFASLTVFGSIFLLFLRELGLPRAQIGMLLSLMPFCGVVSLGFAPVATRLGRRRVFLACWTARKLAVVGLLLLPWVMRRFGHAGGVVYLVAAVAAFAVLRALAETAWYPWQQETVPARVRGRYSANGTVLSTIATCLALAAAGQVVSRGTGSGRFLVVLAAGCVFGVLGVLAMVPVPGGRPRPERPPGAGHAANMHRALQDRNFVRYLAGLGCVTLGMLLYLTFLPLFLRERLGVAPGTVVTMEAAVMIGGALSALLWGRVADRVGSRPVLMSATALALAIPLGWLLLPRQVPHLLLCCAVLYFAHGVALNGNTIGALRLLLNDVIPPDENTAYTALYYAWLGLVGGAAPLLAGGLLQVCGHGERHLGPLAVDGHALLFALAAVLIGAGWICFGRVRPDGRYRTRDVIQRVSERLLLRLSG